MYICIKTIRTMIIKLIVLLLLLCSFVGLITNYQKEDYKEITLFAFLTGFFLSFLITLIFYI